MKYEVTLVDLIVGWIALLVIGPILAYIVILLGYAFVALLFSFFV